MKRACWILVAITAVGLAPASSACPTKGRKGNGQCRQHRHGQAVHGENGRNASHADDKDLFHELLDSRDKITRSVTKLDDGVETLTESEDPAVAEKIRAHVASMDRRIKDTDPIHMRDPLFAEIFANAGRIEMQVEPTDKGVRVRETSTDEHVANLIKAHAEVIDRFLEHGRAEVRKNHAPPSR